MGPPDPSPQSLGLRVEAQLSVPKAYLVCLPWVSEVHGGACERVHNCICVSLCVYGVCVSRSVAVCACVGTENVTMYLCMRAYV